MQLIWDEFLKIIKEEAGSQVVETWFKAVILEHWDPASQTAQLRVPNQFVSRWIQDHYTDLLKKHLGRLLNTQQPRIEFTVATQPQETSRPRTIVPASVLKSMDDEPASQTNYDSVAIIPKRSEDIVLDRRNQQRTTSNINPHYKFGNFVVGPSNSLAHAAAYAICENLGRVYNPLYIYGGTGLGKTHLLHAIGNEVKRQNPDAVIRYETSDNFINEFINSIRFDKSQSFRQRYTKVDVILFDDIQFLSNKEQTQETFFHIFNTLYEQQKQIVLSSDTFPKEIVGLQSRLKSRMEWGLVADIQTPDTETKMAILKKKAELNNVLLPDEVAEFIASRVISNIRELEGSLVRVGAFAALTNQSINIEMARKVLINLAEPKRDGVMLDVILKIVADHFDVSIQDIKSKKRHQAIANIRQIAFYIMKRHSNSSLQSIGSFIGGRDHSTVIHALGKVEQMLKEDASLAQKVKAIEQAVISA